MSAREVLSQVYHAISSLAFPGLCRFCDARASDPVLWLCPTCLESIRSVDPPVCSRCGMPTPGLCADEPSLCGRCLAEPPAYEKARYGYVYEGVLRDAMIRFKYYGALHAGRSLGELLVRHFHDHFESRDFDVIIPIPVPDRRLLQRGFNQAVVLGQPLTAETGIPMDRFSFKKVKDTPRQVGLTRAERIRNLRGSFGFSTPDNVRGKSVLLVDDVATTGSTISEAARTIKSAGAARVTALVLALRPRAVGGTDVQEADKSANNPL